MNSEFCIQDGCDPEITGNKCFHLGFSAREECNRYQYRGKRNSYVNDSSVRCVKMKRKLKDTCYKNKGSCLSSSGKSPTLIFTKQ